MDLDKVIRKLYDERAKLDRIITSLEQLRESSAGLETQALKKRRGRKSMDAEARKEVSERMRRYWANRKKDSDAPKPE